MKKVLFTSILLLSAVSFGGNIYAQNPTGGNNMKVTARSASQPSVKFTADGNTLTISGQGDLTSYMTTDWSAKVFTNKAVNNVFTAANNAFSSVAANSSYDSNNTYYHSVFKYSQLFDGGMPSGTKYVYDVKTTQSWKDEALKGTLYSGYLSYDKTTFILDTKITSAASGLEKLSQTFKNGEDEYSVYVIVPNAEEDYLNKSISLSEDADNYYVKAGIKLLTLAEVNSYVKSTTTYVCGWSYTIFLAKSKDGEKTQLTAGQTYTYDEGDLFYVGNASYEPIADNDEFFKTNSDYITADPKKISVAQLTLSKIQQGAYENVVFKNESSAEPLLIDAAIIRSILYSNNGEANTALKNVDFGEATVNAFDELTFAPTVGHDYIPGHLNITNFTLPLTKKSSVYSETKKANVEKMVLPSKALGKMSGNTIQNVVIPEGYERLGNEAFYGCSHVKNFTFPKSLQVIGDRSFYYCNDLRKIEFSEGLENIGKEAFMGNSLVSVKFPSTLRIINDAAFATASKDPHITNIKLNAGLKYIGNSAFALENDESEGVLEIPASVRYIGPFAFNFRQYQDVYFYGETAPLMPLGFSSYKKDWGEGTGFSEHTLDGNSGFQPLAKSGLGDDINTGYANRENYKNGKAYFCIMHYPKSLSDTDRSTYTDIYRQYKTDPDKNQFHKDDVDGPDGTKGADIVGQEQKEIKFGNCTAGKRVNWGYQDTYLGEQYIWPSQAQFTRAYATASNGLCWDGVTKYPADDDIESYLTEDDIATLEYAGYKIGTGEGEYSKADLAKLAHIGTRQFVLANADSNEDKDEEKEPEYPVDIKGGEWWTICLPFNMTKAMVDETFGKDTQVCLFDRVRRQVNRNTKKNRIVLYFTQNVYKHKTEPKNADGSWNFQETAPAPTDDEIVIYAHESYMIHPTKTGEDAVFAVKNYQPVVGNPTPTVVMGKNEYIGESDTPDNVPYRYVGNYLENVDAQTANQSVDAQALQEVKIPKYSYVYASDGKETKFWFLTSDDMTWKPNKCVVQTNTRGDGERDHEEFFDYNATGAKQASFFGEDFIDTPTSIEDEMVIIAGEGSDAPVYSLDGTLVNSTGDLTGLSKGVYIKGGKKYVVK